MSLVNNDLGWKKIIGLPSLALAICNQTTVHHKLVSASVLFLFCDEQTVLIRSLLAIIVTRSRSGVAISYFFFFFYTGCHLLTIIFHPYRTGCRPTDQRAIGQWDPSTSEILNTVHLWFTKLFIRFRGQCLSYIVVWP